MLSPSTLCKVFPLQREQIPSGPCVVILSPLHSSNISLLWSLSSLFSSQGLGDLPFALGCSFEPFAWLSSCHYSCTYSQGSCSSKPFLTTVSSTPPPISRLPYPLFSEHPPLPVSIFLGPQAAEAQGLRLSLSPRGLQHCQVLADVYYRVVPDLGVVVIKRVTM